MVNFPAHVVVTFFISLVTSLDLQAADGVLVPGGFGDRGVQGKILATKYARENRIPFLGICLGMQIAVIEFARSVLGLKDANSTEFDPNTKNPCVIFMPEVYVSTWLKLILRWNETKFLSAFPFGTNYLDICIMWSGLNNPHGRNHAFGIKEDIFPGYGLQICKAVSTIDHPPGIASTCMHYICIHGKNVVLINELGNAMVSSQVHQSNMDMHIST